MYFKQQTKRFKSYRFDEVGLARLPILRFFKIKGRIAANRLILTGLQDSGGPWQTYWRERTDGRRHTHYREVALCINSAERSFAGPARLVGFSD